MEKQANNSLREQDLTMAQVMALVELNAFEDKAAALKELERRLHVAQSTTAGIVARLEQKGLVEGFGDAEDKRVKMVRLTPLGERQCEITHRCMADEEAKLLSGLTDTERDIFYSLLLKVSKTMD